MGWVSVLFVLKGFDDLSDVALPLAKKWEERLRIRRENDVEIAQLLVEFARIGLLRDLKPDTVSEFGARHGLSRAESMQFAEMGLAVEALPVFASAVKKGDLSVQSLGFVGQAVKDQRLIAAYPLEQWRQDALSKTAADLKTTLDQRRELVRTGAPSVVSLTVHVPETTRKNFSRAREIASRKARASLTEGQTFHTLVEHYLDDFDPERVRPGKRRMPDTTGKKGRHWPAEVVRAVMAICGGRCMYPGCPYKGFKDLAHRVPHCMGGSREICNVAACLCPMHHRRYDLGEFRIEGTLEAPRFYDRKGRRILPNGKVEEEPQRTPVKGLEERAVNGAATPHEASPPRQAPGPPTSERNGSITAGGRGPGTERGPPA